MDSVSGTDGTISNSKIFPGCSHNLNSYRRITQLAFILLIFLIPVFNIFRYDSASMEIIVLGQVWSLNLKQGFYADRGIAGAAHVTLHFFLKAVLPWLFLLSVFPILGYLTGRFFCGWLCPEGSLFEWADFLTLRLLGKRSLYGKKNNDPDAHKEKKLPYVIITFASIVLIPLGGGIALTGYFVAPKTVWHQIINWNFTFGVKAGILGVSLYILIGSMFVRHTFCKYVCAAGLMQTLFGWISPVSLRLKMDAARMAECTDCKGCEKTCFMNILPRKNKRDISCVNCGACIDACNKELGQGRGLFHYAIGEHKCIAPAEDCGNSSTKTLLRVK